MAFKCKLNRMLPILSTWMLVACGVGGPFSTAPSDEELEKFYDRNSLILESFVQFCRDHKNAERVGIGDNEVTLHGDFDKEAFEAAFIVQKSLQILEVDSMACSRMWGLQNPPLLSVTIHNYSSGISVSGSGKGITYLSRYAHGVDSSLASGQLRKLKNDGWFIFTTK